MKSIIQIIAIVSFSLFTACTAQTVITPTYYPNIDKEHSSIAPISQKSLHLRITDMREMSAAVIGYHTPAFEAEPQPLVLEPNVGRTIRNAFETLLISRGHTLGPEDGIVDITVKQFSLKKEEKGLPVKTNATIALQVSVKDATGRIISTLNFTANTANTHVKSFESTRQRLVVDTLNALMQKIDQSAELAAALEQL